MKNQLYFVELVGDLALPLLGYIFWDWNFSFIMLFFLLDVLARTGGMILKFLSFKNYLSVVNTLVQAFLFLLLSFLVLSQVYRETAIINQIFLFWNQKDMGIAQGWLLLLLLPLSEYMRFQNEKKIGITPELSRQILQNNIFRRWLQIGFLGLLFGCVTLVSLPEWGLLILFLVMVALPNPRK